MTTIAKPSPKRSYAWILPLCVLPGLVSSALSGLLWCFRPSPSQLIVWIGGAAAAVFVAVGAWAALRLRAGALTSQSLEGGAQTYRISVGVCGVSAVLLTAKLAPFAYRLLAP